MVVSGWAALLAAAGEDKPECGRCGRALRHNPLAAATLALILPQPPGRLKAAAANRRVAMGAGPAANASVTVTAQGATAATPD